MAKERPTLPLKERGGTVNGDLTIEKDSDVLIKELGHHPIFDTETWMLSQRIHTRFIPTLNNQLHQ